LDHADTAVSAGYALIGENQVGGWQPTEGNRFPSKLDAPSQLTPLHDDEVVDILIRVRLELRAREICPHGHCRIIERVARIDGRQVIVPQQLPELTHSLQQSSYPAAVCHGSRACYCVGVTPEHRDASYAHPVSALQ
jgi:hypothetical protein